MRNNNFFVSILFAAGAGCAAAGGDSLQDPDGEPAGGGAEVQPVAQTLHISPQRLTVRVIDGVPVAEHYKATLVGADGRERDVTDVTHFEVMDSRYGQFAGAELLVSGQGAGEVLIRATTAGASTTATLAVHVKGIRYEGAATAATAAQFAAAVPAEEACAPAISYPSDGLLVPPNLGELDVHWADADHDVFEIAMIGEYTDLRIYTTGRPDAQPTDHKQWTAVDKRDWSMLSSAHTPLKLQVAGVSSSAPAVKCISAGQDVAITGEDMAGGVYYWSTDWNARAEGANGQDIVRYDLTTPDIAPAPLFTGDSRPATCVGCHAISRDGRMVAITLDGATGTGSVLDLANNRMMMPLDGSAPRWSAAAFSADSRKLLAVQDGTMRLLETDGGAVITEVPASTGMLASNPEFSPDNGQLVSVETPSTSDWAFDRGSIVVRSFNDKTNEFGEPRMVLPYEPLKQLQSYYPSWSPDGKWLAVTRSTGDSSYNNTAAEVWVVKADGTQPPIQVTTGGGTADSWARWVPEASTVGDEPVFFLTFSSIRPFGARLPDGGRPQIWFTPFFPARASSGAYAVGQPFRAPFQSIDASNHAAQWTAGVLR